MKNQASLTSVASGVALLAAFAFAPGTAIGDEDHRSHARAAFGRGMNTATPPGNPVNHVILPRDIKIKAGGVVVATMPLQVIGGGRDSRLAVVAFVARDSGTRYLVAAEEANAPVESQLALLRNAMLVGIPALLVVAWAGGRLLARRSLAPIVAIRCPALTASPSRTATDRVCPYALR